MNRLERLNDFQEKINIVKNSVDAIKIIDIINNQELACELALRYIQKEMLLARKNLGGLNFDKEWNKLAPAFNKANKTLFEVRLKKSEEKLKELEKSIENWETFVECVKTLYPLASIKDDSMYIVTEEMGDLDIYIDKYNQYVLRIELEKRSSTFFKPKTKDPQLMYELVKAIWNMENDK